MIKRHYKWLALAVVLLLIAFGVGRALSGRKAQQDAVAQASVAKAQSVVELAASAGLEMPIAEQVVAVIYEGQKVTESVAQLMRRVMKAEPEEVTMGQMGALSGRLCSPRKAGSRSLTG